MNYKDWTELEPGCDVRRNPVGHTLEIAVNDEPGRVYRLDDFGTQWETSL